MSKSLLGKLENLFFVSSEDTDSTSPTEEEVSVSPEKIAALEAELAQPSKSQAQVYQPPSPGTEDHLSWGVEDVYRDAGLPTGKNTVNTVFQLIQSFQGQPENLQLQMIRGVDQIDDTWDEPTVKKDAHQRILALQRHVQGLDLVAKEQEAALMAASPLNQLQQQMEEIELQIQQLNAQRADLQKQMAREQNVQQEALYELAHNVQQIKEQMEGEQAKLETLLSFLNAR